MNNIDELAREQERSSQKEPEPLKAITAAELMISPLPPRVDIIGGGMLPQKGFLMLAGAPGSGKSMLSINLAIAIARGDPILGFDTTQSKVLMLSGEGGPELLKERLDTMLQGDFTGMENLLLWWPERERLDISLEEGRLRLIKYLKEENINLVVIDPMVRFNSLDENSGKEMAELSRGIVEIRQEAAVMLIHHTRKSKDGGNSGAEARGSSVLHGEVDTILILQSRRGSGDHILYSELRWAEEPGPIRLLLNSDTLIFESQGVMEKKQKLSAKKLWEMLREHGPASVEQLVRLTETSTSTVKKYLAELDDQGLSGFELIDRGKKIWCWLPDVKE